LYQAQLGLKGSSAKPLRGFGGAGVLEIVEDHQGDTYRAVYTVTLSDWVLRVTRLPEKIEEGYRDAKVGLISSRNV
jgi:phage-related protein